MRSLRAWTCVFVALAAWSVGCANVDLPYPVGPRLPVRQTPTHGSAVVMSSDHTLAVATNRTAHSVSVFDLTLDAMPTPTATRRRVLAAPEGISEGSEPWAAVISSDENTAYVVLRHAQEVVRIHDLRGRPTLTARVRVGSEPTGLAISPTSRFLYVANWAEGTVSVVDTITMTVARTVDLNGPLAASASLGTVSGRPGLAHPRAVVVTNNGDPRDADETVYVTEFFSQARASGVPEGDAAFDLGRQGVVYRFGAGGGPVTLIPIDPVPDTGFRDSVGSVGGTTGCFPNQLYAAALNAGRLYVTAVCASPRGPVGPVVDPTTRAVTNENNFKTTLHAAVFVIDTGRNVELPAQRVLLTQRFQELFDQPDRAPHCDGDSLPRLPTHPPRVPLIPNDIAFAPGTNVAYVTAYGSDAVFRVKFNPDGTLCRTGGQTPYIRLDRDPAPGHLPVGLAVASSTRAIVLNENSRNLQVLAFNGQVVASQAPSADLPSVVDAIAINDGRRFFVTGLGRWSYRGEGWSSCEGCHPDGLTDNVTWYFSRGPRQTISLAGTYDGMRRQRLLTWTAALDEVHDFESLTRDIGGGVGAIVHTDSTPPAVTDRVAFDTAGGTPPTGVATAQHDLHGSTRAVAALSRVRDWDAIDRYVQTIRAPRAPASLIAADVAAGRALFTPCAACHGGEAWTISRRFYAPGAPNAPMGALRTTTYALNGYDPRRNPPAAMAPARLCSADATASGAGEQINCVLRAVGTFPNALDPAAMRSGVAPDGVPVREVRIDAAGVPAAASGASGYNPPSLVGVATSAPYFHAGNARTLEEVFDARLFSAHYTALDDNFLSGTNRDEQIRQLVAFLRSIDDSTQPVAVPTLPGGINPDLCPTSL